MSGIRVLRKLQIGAETTAGTAADATTIWRGVATLKDARVLEAVEEEVASLIPKSRMYESYREATVEMAAQPATFEQLGYILAAGVEGTVSGSADGSGSGKIYQYDVPVTEAATIQTYTLEGGDNQRVDDVEYAYVEKFTLSGASKEALKISATWRGRQATDAEFTTGLSAPTVEEILFQKGKLYIDASDGTIGATQKTATWLGFQLDAETGLKPLATGDGQLYFTQPVQVGPVIEGSLTLLHDTTGEAELTAARAKSVRKVRMLFQGSALATAGTTYTYKTLIVDLGIQYTEVPGIDDQDGNDTIKLPFRVVDDVSPKFILVNELAALP